MLSMLDRYNVTWQEPAQTDRSAMPLGNGEVGISLWVLADGEIQFYIARTDARTELDRCVKLGKVRIRFTPNTGLTGRTFRQTLVLRKGCIEIRFDEGGEREVSLQVIVDADHPTIFVTGSFTDPVTVQADYQNWRTDPWHDPLSGGIETADVVQYTLPFGTVAEVRQEVADNLRILGEGGGYVLAPCHNLQPVTPPENVVAMYETGYQLGWT